MSELAGSTILTDGAGAPPPGEMGGNPEPMDGADAAVQGAIDAPPEYIPPKFWDAEKKAPKVEDLGRSYQSLEKLLGREKVPVPTSEEDEEGWTRWYSAAGRPDEPDGYEFERPDSLPEDLPYDEETEENFRMWAHVNGLNKRQAKALYDGYVKTQLERHSAYQKHQEDAKVQADQAMRREYGQQYEAKLARAKAALQKYADPDYYQYLNETGAGNDPRMIRAWIKIGEELAGDERLKGNAQPQAQPADLDRAIADFRNKYQKALFEKDHPDHGLRVREYQKLFEARYGDAA